MRLQKATICGLYAVLELASHPEAQISAGEIAAKYDVSLNHLAKVLRALVRARLIESVRGPSGGYRFAANPRRVTLLDVIEVFEDAATRSEPPAPGRSAEERALHRVLVDIDEMEAATLRSASITSLLRIVERERKAVG